MKNIYIRERAQDQGHDNGGRARKNLTNIGQRVLIGIPAQIANIEYEVTISGRTPSRFMGKNGKKRRGTEKSTQAGHD